MAKGALDVIGIITTAIKYIVCTVKSRHLYGYVFHSNQGSQYTNDEFQDKVV